MEEKAKRPRIHVRGIEVVDETVFTENCTSKNARQTKAFPHNIVTNVWIDKHYHDRLHRGEDNGDKREGIDLHLVESLIERTFEYVLYFSLKHKDFLFVNFPPSKTRNIRIVLKQSFTNDESLNVVVEYQFLGFGQYEVTVITAMRKDNFELSNGQYALEFVEGLIELKHNQKGAENIIDTIKL